MSQPASHPWHESIVRTAGRHSPEFVAAVLSAVAHSSSSEIAAAMGVTRNVIVGIVDRARRAGIKVLRKHGRAPTKIAIEKPKPAPKVPMTGARVPRAVLRVVPLPAEPDVRVDFGTRIGILDVRRFECRALDSVGDCCGQPTIAGGSWCAGHRMLYVVGSRRRAA